MNLDVKFDCSTVDWNVVEETLKLVGMGHYDPTVHEKAFKNSYAAVFVYDGKRMAGFGRVLSDGAYQAAVYDVAVHPDYQKAGIGRLIMDHILSKVPSCNIILYASPGKEGFYEKLGFRRMKTSMARFKNQQRMQEKEFIE